MTQEISIDRSQIRETFKRADSRSTSNEWRWYTVICSSAAEGKVSVRIPVYAELAGMRDFVRQTLVPWQWVDYITPTGKKSVKQERMYHGYLFLEARMSADLRDLLQAIPGIVGIVGDRNNVFPKPISQRDMDAAILMMYESINGMSGKIRIDFLPGDSVVIQSGAFNNFSGVVDSVHGHMVKIKTHIFGRDTLVAFDSSIIRKVNKGM